MIKVQTHNVRIPPVTDTAQLLGIYGALFGALGIGMPSDYPFAPVAGFTHPIAEENAKMTKDFMGTKTLLESLRARYINVHLIEARVANSMVVFKIGFEEPH